MNFEPFLRLKVKGSFKFWWSGSTVMRYWYLIVGMVWYGIAKCSPYSPTHGVRHDWNQLAKPGKLLPLLPTIVRGVNSGWPAASLSELISATSLKPSAKLYQRKKKWGAVNHTRCIFRLPLFLRLWGKIMLQH